MAVKEQSDIDKMKAKRDVKGLFKLMAAEDAELFRQAGRALAEIGPSVVDPLLEMTKRTNKPNERQALFAVLTTIGPPAVEPLLAAVKGGDNDKRCIAVDALGHIGDPRAGDAILKVLEDRSGRHYVVSAARAALALGRCIGTGAQEPLLDYLKDDAAHLFGAGYRPAAVALGEIGDEKAIDALIFLLKGPLEVSMLEETRVGIRITAAEALGEIRIRLADGDSLEAARAETALKDAGNDWSEPVREAAAKALGKIKDEREALIQALSEGQLAVEAAKAMLDDAPTYVREAIAEARAAEAATPAQPKVEIATAVDVLVGECAWHFANAANYSALKDEFDRREREVVRPVGESLDREGGLPLMRQVYGEVEAITMQRYGQGCRSALDMKWDGIGGWQG